MPVSIDFAHITFAEPEFLWLLGGPAVLFVLWIRRLTYRRRDLRLFARQRTLPVTERYAPLGDLPFWLCLIVSSAILVVAIARPRGPATAVRQGGIDLVILQDGSASMRVKDVAGDRWQRSIRFLRTLGDAIRSRSDDASSSCGSSAAGGQGAVPDAERGAWVPQLPPVSRRSQVGRGVVRGH